jgi:hypothetical protein
MERVLLQRTNVWYPCFVGVMRKAMHLIAEHEGNKRSYDPVRDGPVDNAWYEIEAACAEYAVAATIQRFWPGDFRSKTKTVDIPPDIEVRWTRHVNGHLLLCDDDIVTSKYVMVSGALPEYFIHGWILGSDGMKQEYYKRPREDRTPRFMVPQSALHPIAELAGEVADGNGQEAL